MSKIGSQVWSRVVIVGATSSVGCELAKLFAAKGSCFLILITIGIEDSKDELTNLAAECKKAGALDILTRSFDSSAPTMESYLKLMTEIKTGYGGIDIMCFSVGMSCNSNVAQFSSEENFLRASVKSVDLTLLNAVLCTHAAFPMLQDGKGVLAIFFNPDLKDQKALSMAGHQSIIDFFKCLNREDQLKFCIKFFESVTYEPDKTLEIDASVKPVSPTKRADSKEVEFIVREISKKVLENQPSSPLKKKNSSFDLITSAIFKKKKK